MATSVGVALAGCSDEEETTTSGNDNSGGENGDDSGGFVFEEHRFEERQFSNYIVGTLLNDTGEEQDYVEVEAKVYDADDVQIDEFFANTTDLPDGGRWEFEVFITADASRVDDYELTASNSAF